MTQIKVVRHLAICIVLLFAASDFGCLGPSNQLAVTLDRMADAQAEYGTMGTSAPILAPPNSNFSFDLTATADTFFNDAQKSRQGSVSELQQSALSFGLGVNGTFNPSAGAAYVAQVQQYQQAVANNNGAQSLTDVKNSLQNSAAYTQYQADVQQANALADPVAKAEAVATARSKLASSLVGPTPTTLPAYPTAATQPAAPTNLVSRPTDLLQQFSGGGNFAGFQGLASNPSPLGITDRTALLTAGGDNATKAIFRLLGDPNLAGGFKDKKILFGVCTVSVEPGWRTQKGFAADITNVVSYRYLPARKSVIDQYAKERSIPASLRDRLRQQSLGLATPQFELPNISDSFLITKEQLAVSPGGPHVAVISPLTDTQTLDLEASDRKQRDISLSLAIAAQLASVGANVQAQSFLKYAKSLEQDFATVSPDVVVNAFSAGTTFGFQVGPRLRAVAEAKSGKFSGAAQILDRQSFPALIILGIERDSFPPFAYWNSTSKRYELYEPVISMTSVNRWVPARQRSGYENIWGLSELGRIFVDRQYFPREQDILTLSQDYINNHAAQKQEINDLSSGPHPEQHASEVESLKRIEEVQVARAQALTTQLIGAKSNTYLPLQFLRLDDRAEVLAVQPSVVQSGATNTIAVIGHDLEDIDLNRISVVTGDVDVNDAARQPPYSATLRDGAIFLQFTPNIIPSFPTSSQIDVNLSLAKANYEAAVAYAARIGQQMTIAEVRVRDTIMKGKLDPTIIKAAEALPEPDQPQTDVISAFVSATKVVAKWQQLQNTAWSNGEIVELAALIAAVKNTTAGLSAVTASNIERALADISTMPKPPANFDTKDTTVMAFGTSVATLIANLRTELTKLLAVQPLPDLTDCRVVGATLSGKWDALNAGEWTRHDEAELTYVISRTHKTTAGLMEATLLGLDDALAALVSKGNKYGTPLDPNQNQVKVLGIAIHSFRDDTKTNLTTRADAAIHRLDALRQAEVTVGIALPAELKEQQDALWIAAGVAKSIPVPPDDALLTDSVNLVSRAFSAVEDQSAGASSIAASSDSAAKLAETNLGQAERIFNQVQKSAATNVADQPTGGMPNSDNVLSTILTAAQSDLSSARANLTQARTATDQTITFALPSKSDPQTVVYTPQIAVHGSDPSDLVVAPQVIQLQSVAPATTSATSGSASGNAATPQITTVLIAGNNLNRVDIKGIVMVPPAKQALAPRVVGTAIAVDINVTSADTPIYFVLPISGSTRHIATPPIAVKAAPSNSNSATADASPTITALYPPGIALARDNNGKPTPNQSFQILLIGNNLDQVDLTAMSVLSGPGKIDPSPANLPSIASGMIRVTLQISDTSAPIVIGLPLKSDKTKVTKSPALVVQ